MTTDDFFEAVQQFSAEHFPGEPAVGVVIRLVSGVKKIYSLPKQASRETKLETGDSQASSLTEIDKTILQAVAELEGSPSGAEIASKAGYPYDAHIKMRLSLLRQRGLLGGAKREAGYPLTEAACKAMVDAL